MLNDVDGLAGRVVCESEVLAFAVGWIFLCGVLFLSGRRFNRIEGHELPP